MDFLPLESASEANFAAPDPDPITPPSPLTPLSGVQLGGLTVLNTARTTFSSNTIQTTQLGFPANLSGGPIVTNTIINQNSPGIQTFGVSSIGGLAPTNVTIGGNVVRNASISSFSLNDILNDPRLGTLSTNTLLGVPANVLTPLPSLSRLAEVFF